MLNESVRNLEIILQAKLGLPLPAKLLSANSVRMGKRGMSPLISTILLIALAVAIGAMIMNWSSAPVVGAEGCNDVKISVQRAFNMDMICYNNELKKIRLVVKNEGTAKVSGIIYRKITPDFKTTEIEVPNSALEPGKVLDTTIGFQKTEQMHIEFIPQIMGSNGQPTFCSNQTIIRESIDDCPTG